MAGYEMGKVHGKSESTGLMAITSIGMAAISRLSQALDVFRGQGPGLPWLGTGGKIGETFCTASQLSALRGRQRQVTSEMMGRCEMLPKNLANNPRYRIPMNMRNLERMRRLSALVLIRHTINEQCFRGGDPGHAQAVEDALRGMRNCMSIIQFNVRAPS
jgi:hypothetical protein